jgi:glutamyl-tRNA synthetase
MEFREVLRSKGFHMDIVRLEMLVALIKERTSFTSEMWDQADFFFRAPETYDPEAVKNRWKEDTAGKLEAFIAVLETATDFTPVALESRTRDWIERSNFKMSEIMNPLRLVIVGAMRGPHMFDIISWIGKEESINRIRKGITVITNF